MRTFLRSVYLSACGALLLGSLAEAQQAYRPGEVIIKLKGQSYSTRSSAFIGKAVVSRDMALKSSWNEMNMHHFALKAGDDVLQKVNELNQDPSVEFAEPNYILTKADIGGVEGVPDTAAQAEINAQASSPYGLSSADIHVAEAWSQLRSDSSYAVVAVIDTGLDLNHFVFTQTGAIWTNTGEIASNGVDDDHNGYIDDVHGWNWVSGTNSPQDDDSHGTHVSGIILGTSQNIFAGSGNLSTAKIKIMPLKFLDSSGSGSVSDAVQAIYYAVNNGAKVLNNSWGGSSFSYSLRDAIAYAYSREVVFVAAAGNYSSNNDATSMYPANYDVPNILSIAATTAADALASFSNFGATKVHLASPGVSIYSTLPSGTFGYMSGTSMATPMVSGIAALMTREKPTMNGYQIKGLLQSSATVFASLYNKVSTSARVDSLAAVNAAKSATVTSSQPVYVASAGSDSSGRSPTSSGPAGCGLVVSKLTADMVSSDDEDGSGPSALQISLFLIVLAMPVAAYLLMRQMVPKRQRRKHERFRVDSEVRVRVGEQELIGSLSSISLGGVGMQLDTDLMLREGGVVQMAIKSPDGQELQVEGRIVWSEAQKHYGVQFSNAQDSVLSTIRQWTRSLVPDGGY